MTHPVEVDTLNPVMDDLAYWIAFHRVSGVGRARFAALEAHFGTLESAWSASESDLRAAGLGQQVIANILEARASFDPLDELERLERHRVRALTWHDPDFPSRLKEIYDVPPVLYVKGEFRSQDDLSLAIVGTRNMTPYGDQVTREFVSDLAAAGLTIVSGMATGIDSVAHDATLKAGARTIAVLASGVDIIYPATERSLSRARDIVENGALISDYPLGTRPLPEYFPRRNRLISGISMGTLVIEGDEKSGALITARSALDQNREVFAVPGSALAQRSRGPNLLIQRGEAKLVLHADDVLQEFNMSQAVRQLTLPSTLAPADKNQATVLSLLSVSPRHIDDIYRESGMTMPAVSSTLTLLEIQDLIQQVGGMHYVRTRDGQAVYATENQTHGEP